MAEVIKNYPVRTGLAFGCTTAIGFYVLPPRMGKLLGSVLIGMMGGGDQFS